jgi:hypothetical protein
MINIDNQELDFQCPNCGFFNPFLFKQAPLRDVIICRGCKGNIHLDDNMNECRKASKSIRNALAGLENSLKNLNLTIRL